MARKRKSTWKALGRMEGSTTTYQLSGTLDPITAAVIGANFIGAWRAEMEARFPTPKGKPRPSPRTVTITLNF